MTSETSDPGDRRRKILILGAGFAGLECARRLANDRRFDVTLVDRNNHHVFQPLLYQVATAALAAPDIARSIRQILEDADNVTVLMDEIEKLDPEHRQVTGRSGHRYDYDYLVLAVGARTSFFGKDHWEKNTLGLKTLADAQTVRRRVLANLERAELSQDPAERQRLMTVAIVGGGPTGVELTGAFVELIHRSLRNDFRRINTRDLRVILIEAGPRLLGPYEEDQSEYAKQRLIDMGAEVRTGTMVQDVQPQKLILANGEILEAAAIIWAAGVRTSPLTAQLGVETDRAGRVTPELDLSLPGRPEIFVIGDLVNLKDAAGVQVPGVAPAATQMGKHVAKLLKEELRLERTRFAADKHSLRPKFTYLDKGNMAIIGKNHAVMQLGRLKFEGFIAWLGWLFVHILFLVGFRNKIAVLLGWAYAYIRNNPEARIIVNTPPPEPSGSER